MELKGFDWKKLFTFDIAGHNHLTDVFAISNTLATAGHSQNVLPQMDIQNALDCWNEMIPLK